VGTGASIIDEQGILVERQRPACESRELRWRMLFGNPFIHTAVMLRRAQVLRTVGFYDETFACAQDYELWFRITDELPVANIPELLVRRRVHSQAITRTRSEPMATVNRLRYARIAPLVGWSALAAEECESRLAIMPALYFGWAESFDPAVLAATVDDVLRLHREFYGREGLPAPALARSERALRSRIAGNLVMLTVFCSTVDVAVRSGLLVRAWQLDRRVFLHPRALARAVRALVGTYIPQLRRPPRAARAPEPAGRA
jgi:hypothetical protein